MAISDFINERSRRGARGWNPASWRNLLLTVPLAIGLCFFLYSSASDSAIADREQQTYGVIRTHEPSNHNRFGYEFSVNGKLYTGWQIPAREYEIGQRILVYYDPLDPTTSSLDSFDTAADQNIGPVFLCVLGIIAVVVVVFAMRRDHARKSWQYNGQ